MLLSIRVPRVVLDPAVRLIPGDFSLAEPHIGSQVPHVGRVGYNRSRVAASRHYALVVQAWRSDPTSGVAGVETSQPKRESPKLVIIGGVETSGAGNGSERLIRKVSLVNNVMSDITHTVVVVVKIEYFRRLRRKTIFEIVHFFQRVKLRIWASPRGVAGFLRVYPMLAELADLTRACVRIQHVKGAHLEHLHRLHCSCCSSRNHRARGSGRKVPRTGSP